ncbi:GNAT family N-acetyltransferase [Streptomyces sp. NPDC047024]|uniref:GNAT family N-acetyltransferase n=1 Tax=Streptomyces sp. NPDC047024 TaxID=3155476 RepID=UPI0033BFEA69
MTHSPRTPHPPHSPLHIRPMLLTDCHRVSEIRVHGWQRAYRDIVSDAYLDKLSVEEDAELRRARFGRGEGVNLVAERDGEVLGWAAYGPGREGEVPDGNGELYALYVDPEHLGGGIGRALLTEVADRCAAYPRVYLWVLTGNTRARRFYERAGFRPDGTEQSFEAGGAQVFEVRYVK